ncbi:MAG TPA: glucose 1-dehydrogenase [Azospirillaceae bacterium]|nr:glucose 1-dehydrogenase [Azospirillaceae bacterium]
MTDPKPFAGQVAVVTGAARGIGLAVVERLARDGADIVAIDLAEAPLAECQAAVAALGSRCVASPGDVSLPETWERAVDAANAAFGRIDILVNNAGISGAIRPILDYPVDVFDRVMAVNARSVFLGMKMVAPSMKERGGAIVNISSISGLGGGRNIVAYTASKHAVIGMTKGAAIELAAFGIRVNAVCPSPTATDMVFALERKHGAEDLDAFRRSFVQGVPLGRYAEPHEIAAAVAFLASREASFMTGTAVPVDGGDMAD